MAGRETAGKCEVLGEKPKTGEKEEEILVKISRLSRLAVLTLCNDRKKAVPSWFLLLLEVVSSELFHSLTATTNW